MLLRKLSFLCITLSVLISGSSFAQEQSRFLEFDRSFGDNGRVELLFVPRSIVIVPRDRRNKRIFILHTEQDEFSYIICYNQDGILDTSFQADGRKNFDEGVEVNAMTLSPDREHVIVLAYNMIDEENIIYMLDNNGDNAAWFNNGHPFYFQDDDAHASVQLRHIVSNENNSITALGSAPGSDTYAYTFKFFVSPTFEVEITKNEDPICDTFSSIKNVVSLPNNLIMLAMRNQQDVDDSTPSSLRAYQYSSSEEDGSLELEEIGFGNTLQEHYRLPASGLYEFNIDTVMRALNGSVMVGGCLTEFRDVESGDVSWNRGFIQSIDMTNDQATIIPSRGFMVPGLMSVTNAIEPYEHEFIISGFELEPDPISRRFVHKFYIGRYRTPSRFLQASPGVVELLRAREIQRK